MRKIPKQRETVLYKLKPETDLEHSYQEGFESGILDSLLSERTPLGLLSPDAPIIF